MAEPLIDIHDDPEKNFLLAKLASLYGDIVELDVINLVAQENDWIEEKCIEYLQVLGDYKNSDADAKCPQEDQVSHEIVSIVSNATSDVQLELPKKTEVEESALTGKIIRGKLFSGVTRTVKPVMAGNNGRAQGKMQPVRQLSPPNTGVHKSSETEEHHKNVKELIKSGVPVIILLRGLPGSGKSCLARNLLSTPGARGSVHSTDEFFQVPRGGKGRTCYQYDPLRLAEAHEWNRVQVLRAIAHGVTPIIVDNTNIQKWEMLPYVEMALEPWEAERKLISMAANGSLPKKNICSSLGPDRQLMIGKTCSCGFVIGEICKVPYKVEILEPLTWWYRNPARLAKVNQHGVSQKKITQMLSNFDFNITGKSLVDHILKIKPRTSAVPRSDNIKPSNQSRKQVTASAVSGSPIYNIKQQTLIQGNQHGARPRHFPPNIGGSNSFSPLAANQFHDTTRFPITPHQIHQIPPLLGYNQHPSGPTFPNSSQMFFNNFKPHHPMDQQFKGKLKKEDFNMFSLTHQSSLSKSSSNISFGPRDNNGAYSSQLEVNPFKSSGAASESNIHEKSLEDFSFVGSECKEMTEEELDEWMKNNSKWGWESSDDDSEGDPIIDSNEPKPERVLKPRNKGRNEKGLKECDDKSCKGEDDTSINEKVSEWVIEEDNSLISWDTPDVTIENPKVETIGPLPPRNSKRKRGVGNATHTDNNPDEGKKSNEPEQPEAMVTEKIHSSLDGFAVINKELEFYEDNSKYKIDENNSMSKYVDSVYSFEDSIECSNSNLSKSHCNSTKDGESFVKLDIPPLKQEIKSESLIDIGAESSIDNDLTFKDTMDNSCKDESCENSELSFSSTHELSAMTQENVMLLAPLIKKGLLWFEHVQKIASNKEDQRDDSVMNECIQNMQAGSCEETSVNVSKSSAVDNSKQDEESINCSEHSASSEIEEKVPLVEKSKLLDKIQTKENEESIHDSIVLEEELMSINCSPILSEISHVTKEVKELEPSSQIEVDDKVSVICSSDPSQYSEVKENDIQSVGASDKITVSQSNNIIITNELHGHRNVQGITESVLKTPDVEVQEKKNSDENELQSCIPSTSSAPHSVTHESDHSCGKEDLTYAEDQQELKIVSETVREPEVSLLEIIENLRKKREAGMMHSSVVELEMEEKREITIAEEISRIDHSEAESYPNVQATGQDTSDVPTLSALCINEEKDSVFKKTSKNELCPTDWSVLYENEPGDLDGESETFPLVLDSNFIKQICQKFGNPYQDSVDESLKFSSTGNDSRFTVQVPSSLAKKLHECWLKTQWNSILDEEEASQKMVIEDELLAHQLQALEEEELKEEKEHKSGNTPDLREIMDMEMAMAIYKADQNRNRAPLHKNDLSTRLSWDMLTKEFPHIPQDTVTEVFSAYNFSYESTREALVASLPDYERSLHENKVKDVFSPEILAAQEKALIEKAKFESLKSKEPPVELEEEVVEGEDEGNWKDQVDEARKAASLNRRLQKERHAQAQAASRSGIPSAAAYYCRMASLHKQKVDDANRKAANILSRVFTGEYNELKGDETENKKISQPPMTLDMHSMTVLEALRVLNAFLDAHAEWLRNNKRRSTQNKTVTLFLITGRGINSVGGIPRIKPAVEKQLEKRGVWYEELNPGLLRVMVSASLAHTRKL